MRRTSMKTGTHWVAALLVAFICMVAAMPAHAAAPDAGTQIGNTATATYTDASSISRTATSNTVTTVVLQVAALTLTSSQSKYVAIGATVYFPHVLTNTGNGTDSFSLSTTDLNTGAPGFNPSNIAMYADANGDGVPDNLAAPITSSGSLARNGIFRFVVGVTAPGTVSAGDNENIRVTATSVFDGTVTTNNTDTVTVSAYAIINVTKAVSPGTGPADGATEYTYTLSYSNTGGAAATAFTITDQIPTNMAYATGDKARWSIIPSTALTDADKTDTQGTGPTIIYDYDVTAGGTVTAVISSVAANTSGTLSFKVKVPLGTAPGTINNTATFTYHNSSATVNGSSNTVPFTVLQNYSVTINDNPSAQDQDAATDDIVTRNTAEMGTVVTFDATVTNTGNGSDSFDITVTNVSFPAGTSFTLYNSANTALLVDNNGNSVPDTGTLATSGTYKVYIRATLPPGVSSGTVNYTATVKATSKGDNTKNDTTTIKLVAVTANTVDVTNTYASGTGSCDEVGDSCGYGPTTTGEAAAQETKTANASTPVTFILKVKNTSAITETYDMAASTDNTFASITLPTGWSVAFKADGGAGDCSTVGANITNTGSIASGSTGTVCAIVSVTSSAVATPTAGTKLYYRAKSPASTAYDVKTDAVKINAVRSLTVTPNSTGQVYPGLYIDYSFTVTNTGNVTEGTVASAGAPDGSTDSKVLIATSNTDAAWTTVLFFDADGDGAIDTGETKGDLSFTSNGAAGLAPGESVTLTVRVTAPAGALPGNSNVTTLTATTSGVIYTVAAPSASSATATTTVIAGQVSLTKKHALDAACDGTADAAYTTADINAKPGECVRYEIRAKNIGSAAVTGLVVSDLIPMKTRYNTGAVCTSSSSAGAATTIGSIDAGSVSNCTAGNGTSVKVIANVGTLNSGAEAVITFGVEIDK